MTQQSNVPLTEARDRSDCGNGATVHDTSHLAARRSTVAASLGENVGSRGWQRQQRYQQRCGFSSALSLKYVHLNHRNRSKKRSLTAFIIEKTNFMCLFSNFSCVRSFHPRPVERNVTWNVVWYDCREDTKKTNLVAYN